MMRESRVNVLTARHDDDDDDLLYFQFICRPFLDSCDAFFFLVS